MMQQLKDALSAAETGRGSYGPNYDGQKLAAGIQTLIQQLQSGAGERVYDEAGLKTVGRDIDDMPQPFAGAVVLLETIAHCGAISFDDAGQPTENRKLCLRFADELRVAGRSAQTTEVQTS